MSEKTYSDDLLDAGVTESEIFEYLNDLRESGVTNMLGAPAYLVSTFGLTIKSSRELLIAWIEEF